MQRDSLHREKRGNARDSDRNVTGRANRKHGTIAERDIDTMHRLKRWLGVVDRNSKNTFAKTRSSCARRGRHLVHGRGIPLSLDRSWRSGFDHMRSPSTRMVKLPSRFGKSRGSVNETPNFCASWGNYDFARRC